MTDQMEFAKMIQAKWSESWKTMSGLDFDKKFNLVKAPDLRKIFMGVVFSKKDCIDAVEYYKNTIQTCGNSTFIGQYYREMLEHQHEIEKIENREKKYFFAFAHMSRQDMSKYYTMNCHPTKRWTYYSGEIKFYNSSGIYCSGCEWIKLFTTKKEMESFIVEYFGGKLIDSHTSYVIATTDEKGKFIGKGGQMIKFVQSLIGNKKIILK